MVVWTLELGAKRVAVPVLKTTTHVPGLFRVVSIALDDGRTIMASPGHPSAEGRPLGDYRVGDTLDQGIVSSAELVFYEDGETYDILPSGSARLYWAGGILLMSTIHQQ